ncbi:hypothetical protein [Thermoplasma volcanium GSS1]|uniref:SMP-30/Gluconolactonase/LRE-like region domain-containing protein n=1 Tax=Thermoplasma volcanium (strain ATCC 51530 / DSM 4299 / JCM 9571 / NBRC 15438 / GSS1) TaxID=273116 RepID=Q97A53_THEVO|nr:SMP-30/gluconolactonase/LRE family protein [Thermoplasma volcanium]BAB60099.1 hypothetical protein [Thermoplasma volcanium GSS1]
MDMKIIAKKIDQLGEGPTYDSKRNRVYWIDITGKKFHYLDLNDGSIYNFESVGMISSIVPTNIDLMAATIGHGFYSIDDQANHTLLFELKDESNETRFNDGKADPEGRYVAGTMDLKESRPIGSLYVFNGKGVRRLLSNLTISNGIAWDTRRRIFYHIDTPTRKVRAYSFDAEMNIISKDIAVDFKEEQGSPDGMTIDSDGNLFVAHWGGSKLSVWDPERKRKIDEYDLPAKNITSAVFAGKGLNTLYVSSASSGDPEDLGGSLFELETQYKGTPTFVFKIR